MQLSILSLLHRSLIKAAVVLQPLLGCTWIIGLFTINRNTIAFAYVFTILNVLQVKN